MKIKVIMNGLLNLKIFREDLEKCLQKKLMKSFERKIFITMILLKEIFYNLKNYPIQKNGFINYMKSVGKLGGQNKVPRLSNDRKIADELQQWIKKSSAEPMANP